MMTLFTCKYTLYIPSILQFLLHNKKIECIKVVLKQLKKS